MGSVGRNRELLPYSFCAVSDVRAACRRGSAVSQELLNEGFHRFQHCAPMLCFKGAAGAGGAGWDGAVGRRMCGGC